MNPCILFIDPCHGSADRYLPRWNMANCYINCHCIEHRVRVEPRVHSGLERLGGTPGAPPGISGGRGRVGRQSSRLLRAIEITRVSLKSPRTTRSVAISTPPDRQLLSQSLGIPSVFVGTRKKASRRESSRRWCGTHLPLPSRWEIRARRDKIRCRDYSLSLKSRSTTWRSSFSVISGEVGGGF